MPHSDDELRGRIETLERIVVAMCSGQQFAITLDENNRPQMWSEIPAAHVPRSISVNPK